MRGNSRHGWGRTGWMALVLAMAAALPAAPPADGGSEQRPGTRPAAGAETQPAEPLREETIYIPYTKLREVFERDGRGVFLPYGEFEKLWKAARDNTGQPPTAEPPVKFLISEVENQATVAKEVVQVQARVKIELLTGGWHHIPLGLADAAVTRATIGEQPARILFDAKSGYELLIENTSGAAKSLPLNLEFAKAYEKAAGRNSVSFQSPRSPVSRWHITIPESGVKVNITPLIAATEVPEKSATQPAEVTEVLAFVGAAPVVKIDWTPKAEGATGLATLATVQTEQQVRIDDGVIRTRTQLVYEISRAALAELLVEVPTDQRVINVLDANVRQWSIVSADASDDSGPANPENDTRQRIAIQLFEPARTRQNIVLELEKFVSETEQQKLQVPMVTAVGVGRQQGIVVAAVAEGLKAETLEHTGLQQIDAGELPQSLSKSQWLFAYRYSALPYGLSLRVDKVQPRILADTLIEATLEPELLLLNVLSVYTIERAGVFRLEYDLPAGYDVRQVVGQAVENGQPVQVDSHHVEGADKSKLTINLSSKALGRVAVEIRLQRRLSESDLLSPTGRAAEIPLSIPRVSGANVEQATGRLMVRATENLRVNPGKSQGLRSVSFKEALEGIKPAQESGGGGARPVLAFTYAREEVSLTLLAERRKPQVTVGQVLLARIEPGVIRYWATFNYEILYSGVPSLRIDVPAELAPDIRNNTSGVREKVMDPPPQDLPAGYVAWSLVGETELAGKVQVKLSWERKLDELAVGKSIEVSLPHLKPAAVDRAWGQIVWTKAETLDVHETGEPVGVRPIDPQHDLMPGTSAEGAARAFEFHDDWVLHIAITRYKLQEVKTTSIERAVLQMVATRSDQVAARALYRMRSAGQRLAVRLPSDVEFDSEPLRINGRPVALERGEQQEYFVPLVGIKAETPFLLELRYSLPEGGRSFSPPTFPSQPAAQKAYLCVYLPEEMSYLGSRGPWNDEITWYWDSLLNVKPRPSQQVDYLLHWVRQGVGLPDNGGETFQIAGQPLLFSTLRPSAANATLRVTAMDEDWLSAAVFGVILAIGVVLLRFGAAVRYVVAGVFLVLLIVSGVFLPTFFRQILDDTLLAAVAIVLVLWALQYLIWTRPSDPATQARRQARMDAKLARSARTAPPSPEPPPASDRPNTPEGGEGHA